MAKKSTAAQHFLECDNCEENPAKFLCKTCPGHLCENCKTQHEKKKITRSHDIVSLISNNEDMVDLLYCTEHTKKKLECYCNRCKEPVCTDCIIQSHNGHSVESLSAVYKRITDYAKQQKEKIDNLILPKYRDLLSDETVKHAALSKRAEEIKKKIEAHTQKLVEMIVTIGAQRVEDLSKKEEDGLREIEQTMSNIKEQIKKLELMSKTISSDIEAKPAISFFKLVERYNLKSFERTISTTNYSLSDFQPGDTRTLKENFGIQPNLQRSGDRESITYLNCKIDTQLEIIPGDILAITPFKTRTDLQRQREMERENERQRETLRNACKKKLEDDFQRLREMERENERQRETLINAPKENWEDELQYFQEMQRENERQRETIKNAWKKKLEDDLQRQREMERENERQRETLINAPKEKLEDKLQFFSIFMKCKENTKDNGKQ